MIGETMLAVLYVLLFFYLLDRLHERGCMNRKSSSPEGNIHNIEGTLDDAAAEKKKDK